MLSVQKYDIINIFGSIFNELGIKAYLVGGAVRDMLLGIEPIDFDFAAEIDEDRHLDVCGRISDKLGLRYEYNSFYHTAKFYYNEYDVDFVMARREYYPETASRPVVVSSGIKYDLQRRDFTVNSMAVLLDKNNYGVLVDPFNGIQDLNQGILRVLHPKSFRDDPTRIFRGIKYASRFGFEFEADTCELVFNAVKGRYMKYLKPGRIKQELAEILNEARAIPGIELVEYFDILGSIIECEIVLNTSFSEEFYKNIDINLKFAVMLYKNRREVLDVIRNSLELSSVTVENAVRIKELDEILKEEEMVVYKYLFKNENRLNSSLLNSVFYNENRVLNFIGHKDKILLYPEEISEKDERFRNEYIIDKKAEMLAKLAKEEV